jgi:hypothetical protein
MKLLKSIFIGMLLFLASTIQAQVVVRLNLGSPPMWGPAGYNEARYYYLPDVEAYYDVQSSMFIYSTGGAWVHRRYLPTRYRNYDLYGGYKVVMTDYHGDAPYTNFKEYKTKYARGYHGQSQKSIGDRPGKGNSKANTISKGNSKAKIVSKRNSNKGVSQGNSRNAGHSNKKMKINTDNSRGKRNKK